jgi:hypothetical protein
MSLLPDLFRPMWPIGLNNVRQKTCRMTDWINRHEFEFHAPIASQDNFDCSNYSDTFLFCLAYEIDRWACASIESLSHSPGKRFSKKSIAWDVVRAYYASYYAAHAILRICGDLIVNIDDRNVRSLQQVARLSFPASIKPSSGYYIVKHKSSQNTLEFRRNTTANSGSHNFLWRSFYDCLERAISGPDAKTTVYQPATLALTNLKEILCQGGNSLGQWLSTVRNDVNYKLAHGIWYPYTNSKSNEYYESLIDQLSAACDSTKSITLSHARNDPLNGFMVAVRFIVGLMRELLADLHARCAFGVSFLSQGSFRLLRRMDEAA